MKEIMKRIKADQNRQHAVGRGLQLSGAGCRACHHEFKENFFESFTAKLSAWASKCSERNIWKKRGQHIAEYAVLVTVLSVGLTMMYVYVKRGLEAVIKQQVDTDIGPQINSAPLLDDRELQGSNTSSDAVVHDASRVQASSAGAVRYVSNSVSNAAGHTSITSGQIFFPEGTE
ncbi:MAG: hypothetical protein ABIC68_00330 [Candidatus Omnitrophota bacterium]